MAEIIEEWKIVEEIQTYEVSNKGNVRNKKTTRSISLVPKGNGYIHVTLRKGNKYVNRAVV